MKDGALDRSTPPPPGPLRPFQFPAIERFELSNGIRVLFAETHGMPVVTCSMLIPGGALRERPERAGVATLTGSTLESGTTRKTAAEIARELETAGVRLGVGTSWETSHLDFTCLSDRMAAGASIAAELIAEPSFPTDEVDRIRSEMLAGIMQRRAEPRGLANEMASKYVFAETSPFARPVSGTPESVGAVARSDVLEFHRSTYTPVGAGIIIAGRMRPDEAKDVAEAAFGPLSGATPPAAPAPADPRSSKVQVVVVARPGAVQSEIRVGHLGPPRGTPDYFAVHVMNTILGGAFTSRLNLNLREKHGFTYGVNSSFIMRRAPGPFLVSTAVQTEVTGRAVAEILAELRRIREAPVEDAELDDARQYLAGTYPLRLQTTDGVAARLADLFIYDLPDSYLDEFAARVLAVSREEVHQAANTHIHPERSMILVVGSPDEVVPQLEALEIGTVETVTVDG